MLNEWTHLAASFDGTKSIVYVNGIDVSLNRIYWERGPRGLVRNQCWIGKSAWADNKMPNAYFDEIRIYKIALSRTEIRNIVESDSISDKSKNGLLVIINGHIRLLKFLDK